MASPKAKQKELQPTAQTTAEARILAGKIPVFCAYDELKSPLDITGNPRNPNKHPEEQLKLLAHIIQSQGWRAPITVSRQSGLVVRGHGRLAAALLFGAETVPVDYQNYGNAAEEWADLIADNRIAEFAVMGESEIASLLAEMQEQYPDFDVNLTGYTEEYFNELAERLGGNSAGRQAQARLTLAEKFIVPPFSVLDARSGAWPERKRAWKDLGIKSDTGRGADGDKTQSGLTFAKSSQPPGVYKAKNDYESKIGSKITWDEFTELFPEEMSQPGTSIFDPVLTEVLYRWFCPPGGSIIDPFAGGSVRGVVAALTGYEYTGVDLSEQQIEANYKNWEEITTATRPAETETPQAEATAELKEIQVSGKWARHQFCCNVEYINTTCHGKCCQGTDKVLISLLPEEVLKQEQEGFPTKNGLLLPDPTTGKCPHKKANGLCGIHMTDYKPFGCIASPFTLNDGDTLIIRNRYNMMKCHGQGEPAYITFRASLDLILGDKAEEVIQQIVAGADSVSVQIPKKVYDNLKYLDSLKHAEPPAQQLAVKQNATPPRWINGDSQNITTLAAGQYDLLFTCPPYADLEVYSDDPADISTKAYPEFVELYSAIIRQTTALLKPNRFACVVVGEVRDKDGNYYNFVSDTIKAFTAAGLKYYNEAILITNTGSLPIRVGKQFAKSRKVGKTHQNILVFHNGNPYETGVFDQTTPETATTDSDTYRADHQGRLGKAHQNILVFTNGDPAKAAADIGTVEMDEHITHVDNAETLGRMLGNGDEG